MKFDFDWPSVSEEMFKECGKRRSVNQLTQGYSWTGHTCQYNMHMFWAVLD